MKRRRTNYQKSIIIGFVALYVMCMLFSTCLVQENYKTAYQDDMSNKLSSLRDSIYEPYFTKFNEDGTLNENYVQEITRALSAGLKNGNKYNQYSAALYGPDKTIVARTTEYFGEVELIYDIETSPVYPDAMVVNSPYDFFTEEEIDLILSYLEAEYKEGKKNTEIRDSYELYLKYDSNTGEPLWLEISKQEMKQEIQVNENGIEMNQYELLGDGEVLWTWTNPDVKNYNEEVYKNESVRATSCSIISNFSFPYLAEGRKYYDAWKNDEILQCFDVEDAFRDSEYYISNVKKDDNHRSVIYPLQLKDEAMISSHEKIFYMTDGPLNFALQINQAFYPWHAAIDYMKYVYLYGALLMLVCMMKVLYTTKKAYQKQEELEQTRRDFVNAAAHELKTPLSIVRGLAETMEETHQEEKKAVYRAEIVRQTEVMDQLVKEMIFISKLDSDQLLLKKEDISIYSVIEEQLLKLTLMAEEKNIQVELCKEEDFVISGDKIFIEKALFNLIENAISHNYSDGRVDIRIEKDICIIENTAERIPEEDLPYLCDLFFTSNKSRTADVHHKGLGLYLTKRIFDIHNLNMKIENTEVGVRVSVAGNKRK